MNHQSTSTVRDRPVTTQIAFFWGIGHVKPTSMVIHAPIYIIKDFSAFSAYELYTSSELSPKQGYEKKVTFQKVSKKVKTGVTAISRK